MQKYINQKLGSIQTDIKCGKSNYNSFGKYGYRSTEDICESVKPYETEHQVTFILSDEMIEIAGRVYVEATASITCNVSGESISVKAQAREPQIIKGMSEMQITGATASYARKRALAGLLLLDDTQDADGFNKHDDKSEKTNNNNVNGEDDLL
jgi:hypothetical protein